MSDSRCLVFWLLPLFLVACDRRSQTPVAPVAPTPIARTPVAPTPIAQTPVAPARSVADYRADLGRANTLFKEGRYPEAAESFEALTAAFPERAAAYYGLWMTHGKLGDREGEARALKSLRAISGSSVASHAEMSQTEASPHDVGDDEGASEFFFLGEKTPLFVDEVKREVRLFTRLNRGYLKAPSPRLVGGEGALLDSPVEAAKLYRALVQIGAAGAERPPLDVTLTWKDAPGEVSLAKLLKLSDGGFLLRSSNAASASRVGGLVAMSSGVVTPKDLPTQPEAEGALLPSNGTAVMVVLRSQR